MFEYYVIIKDGKMFAGFHKGDIYWTDKVNEAKPLYNIDNFNFFKRWFSYLEPKIFYF